jgi:hypothetical protein
MARSGLKIFVVSLGVILLSLSFSQVLSRDTSSSKIELKAWTDKLQIGSDEDLVFTVQAIWEGELDRFEIEPIRPPECKLLEISGSSSVNETKIVQGKSKTFKTFSFVLRPTQQGRGQVASVEFTYVDPITQDTSRLYTQPIVIQVGPPVKKEGGDAVIYLVLILVIFFTTLTYLVMRKREREAKEQKIKKEEDVRMSPKDETSEKLSSLQALLEGGETEEFFSRVHRMLTRHLEEKYHIVTTGKTTAGIMSSLSHLSIEEESIKLLESVLKRCDLVKFAKEKIEKDDKKTALEELKTILEQS